MGGAVPILPQYAFMAWYSVRRSTGTTLPFYLFRSSPIPSLRLRSVTMFRSDAVRKRICALYSSHLFQSTEF
jgi:hypothetical protein